MHCNILKSHRMLTSVVKKSISLLVEVDEEEQLTVKEGIAALLTSDVQYSGIFS